MEKEKISNNTPCENCDSNVFFLYDNFLTCDNCGLILSKKSKINNDEKNKNKIIHLNNVLKNLETINVMYIEKLHDELLETIKKENIDTKFIDSTYICEFLKKKGIKKYIVDIWLLYRYKNIEFKLSNKDKEIIKIIFKEYTKYLCYIKTTNNSISYHQILYIIYKYLDIDLDVNLKPSITKNNNNHILNTFNDFLNYLCEKYYNEKSDKTNDIIFVPEINNFPNSFYSKDMFI